MKEVIMFFKQETKKFIVAIFALIFATLCGICGVCAFNTKQAFADDPPEYLSIRSSFGNRSFLNNSTIFLSPSEKLNITLGKPITAIPTETSGDGTITKPYEKQSDIGPYALSFVEQSFSLKINDVQQNLGAFKSGTNPFLQFVSYELKGNKSTFMYFDLNIDLNALNGENTNYFPTGEYVLTFENYLEFSDVDFLIKKERTFSIKLYIFNTSDYFKTTGSGLSQNVEFLNVEHSSPNSISYRNSYFFNYSNLNTQSVLTTQNFLPQLNFDARKFVVTISKSVAGSTYSCVISKFNNELVTLNQTTTKNFLTATFNETTQEITVNFQDIGEYVIEYQFVFEDYNNKAVALESEEILANNEKSDLLTIFGYQMYYGGQVGEQTEFKAYNDDKSATLASKSADVTYLFNSSESDCIKKTFLTDGEKLTHFDNTDVNIFSKIKTTNLQPVSTNQPTIVLNTISQLKTDLSCYYFFENNIIPDALPTNAFDKLDNQPFSNQTFSKSGTYLLRVVYTQPTYYNSLGKLDENTYFAQYFFFSITSSTPSVSIIENIVNGKTLNSNDFTNNNVNVTLAGQSIFNREVTMQIYKKTFSANSNFVPLTSLKAQESDVNVELSDEGYYWVQTTSGKNTSRSTFFTIDKTAISGINIIPVEMNKNNKYTKDSNSNNFVDFFTQENVVVEWKEKASGAKTFAYYQYIPFTPNTNPVSPEISNTIHKDTNVEGIITTDSLDLKLDVTYDKASYTNNLNQVNPSQIFTSQGLYIFYVSDQAGNKATFAFCIDKTEIQVMQYDPSNMQYDTVKGYNLVTRDKTTIEWGDYKLIDLNLQQNNIESILDQDVKIFFQNKFNEENSKIRKINQDLYFAVKISSTYVLKTGTNLDIVTSNKGSDTVKLIVEENGQNFANEMSYNYYLIDESNKVFKYITSLSATQIVENNDKSYQITTSSDASNANVFVNNATTLNEYVLNASSIGLSQVGFADSYSDPATLASPDTRTKYYNATGSTLANKVDMLAYKIKLNLSENLYVSKITMYYYPFVTNNAHDKTLSSDFIPTILYDSNDQSQAQPTKLTGEGNEGYYAFNINVGNYQSLTQYQTLPGKYVIVREYNTPVGATQNYDTYDFKIRESVFVVDREEIVSSPESFEEELISTVGNGIYINVLDGVENAKQFKNIYSAKNNAQTYILQTNKLPVVVYVPTVKYGHQKSLTEFTADALLNYYLATHDNNLIRPETEAKLERISFGKTIIDKNFAGNIQHYASTDYDLTVTITAEDGTKISCNKNGYGYLQSSAITQTGSYEVEIIQNDLFGKTYPNVYNTFKFSFEILELPPNFIFTDPADTQNAGTLNTDEREIYYTNIDDEIKVVWTDPDDTTYFAKINREYNPDNGNTKIKYYITTPQGTTLQPVFIKYNDIKSSDDGRTHWFTIPINNLNSDYILNVYMEYERGVIVGSNSEFERLTTVTKQLYIDRIAPTENLEKLAEKTIINGFNLASNTRKNVDIDKNGEIVDTTKHKKYNITQSNGAYANYAFAVENEFISMLSTHPNSTYKTSGSFFKIEKVPDITQYNIKSIDKSSITNTLQTLTTKQYYEVTEMDLAGNVAIYLIYVVDPDFNSEVLALNRDKTDVEQDNKLTFNEISTTQEIYAKNFLDITSIDLYNYPFLTFNLDGQSYFKSTALPNNQFYVTSSITSDLAENIKTISLENLFKFTAPSHHTLILNDSVLGQNYTFELYVDNKNLGYNLLTTGEGINIQSTSLSNIKHFLSSIKISSYDINLDKYVVIYEQVGTFASTPSVNATVENTSYTFSIVSPNKAYIYEFTDNYGVNYIEYHTAGSFVLNEDQKVKNYFDKVIISETIGSETTSNEWYVGNSNVIFNYSSSEYNAYLKIYKLIQNTDNTFDWQEVKNPLDDEYGISLIGQTGNVIVDDVLYCSLSPSPIHSTVKQLTLQAPATNIFPNSFTGSVYRYEITLVNHYDNSPSKNITNRILINNLTPIIDLKDKNNQSVTSTDALYTEQISVIVPTLQSVSDKLFSNNEVAKYLFDMKQYLVFNETSTPLTSGTIVTEPGQYKVDVYDLINDNQYLINSKTFIIADSPTAFYQIWVQDDLTGELVLAQTTGKEYTYGNTICYHHYIVNNEPKFFLNESQSIQKEIVAVITNENITTTIYRISNYNKIEDDSYNIIPYETKIAVTQIAKTDSILSNFTYTLDNGEGKTLGGTGTNVIVTENEQNTDTLTIKFKSYYGIPENAISVYYTWEGKTYYVDQNASKLDSTNSAFTLSNSGEYYLFFTDVAGNKQIFRDNRNIEQTYSYKILFIKGVPYLINGENPIQNAIYNDKVEITVPAYLNNWYDTGGKPKIAVYKNGELLDNIKAENGVYTLKDDGYYSVYFDALVNGSPLKKEAYNFQIKSSSSYVSSFNYAEFGKYEIKSIFKNNVDITSTIKRLYGLNTNDKLSTLTISLYDEKTGQGNYKVTILTHSGLYSLQDGKQIPEQFTFEFVIKSPITVPISVSVSEGSVTKKPIKIEFNALDLFNEIGKCKIIYGDKSLVVDEEYINSLNNNYFCSLQITERGTHYVQVYSSSNNLLYSYRVDKKDPLNTVSIILIVGGVAVAIGLTVTIILLRRKMKIK